MTNLIIKSINCCFVASGYKVPINVNCHFYATINTNLRASDLCNFTAGMVCKLNPMDEIELEDKIERE